MLDIEFPCSFIVSDPSLFSKTITFSNFRFFNFWGIAKHLLSKLAEQINTLYFFFLKMFRQSYFQFIIAYFLCRMLILLIVVSCRCLNSTLRMSMRWFRTIRFFTIMLHIFISFCVYIDFCLFFSVSICVWNAKWDVYTMLNLQRLLLFYNLLCRDIAYST